MGRWRGRNRRRRLLFYDAGDSVRAECGNTGRNEGRTGAQVLAQFVIERTNGFGLDRHRDRWPHISRAPEF
jgi:hypothetical protein